MFRFPDAMSPERFLERHWQKAALFMPEAMSHDLPGLSAGELAWLATLDDVESRLVFTEGGMTQYRVEHGPFEEARLSALPNENWTLLVQDVDKHLPDFRRYFEEAAFIPDWRIDDVMVSFAVAGGGVGPHRDNYDVFLCQGDGRREWRIAPADANLQAVESGGLALLKPFEDDSPVRTNTGDALYLPPGLAHWSVATEHCMTYSIGMRAPQLPDGSFYSDPDLVLDEAEPGLISQRALERAQQGFPPDSNLVHDFGCLVTGVKAWLRPDAPTQEEIDAYLESDLLDCPVHGMARLAFCTVGKQNHVFVNGYCNRVSAEQLELFRRICADRTAQVDRGELFLWLADKGAFDLLTSQESAR